MRFYESQYRERIGYDFYCDIASRTVEAKTEYAGERRENRAP